MEQVALEEGGDLEVLRPAERRHLAEPLRQARFEALGGIPFRRRPRDDVRVEEPEQARRVRKAQAVAVERVVRLGQALAVEADEKRARTLEILPDEGVQPGEQERAQRRLRLARPEVPHLVLAEDVVAGEELVRALAGRDHLEPGLPYGPREP